MCPRTCSACGRRNVPCLEGALLFCWRRGFDNTGRVIVRGALDAASAVGRTDEAFRQTSRPQPTLSQAAALQKLYDKYRLVRDASRTSDGFSKNPDDSAAGSFNNLLPVDQAFALANGQKMTMDQATAAMKQAEDALKDMQAFTRQNPGASSIEYQQSTMALYQAARAAFERLTAARVGGTPAGTAAPQTASGTSRTVNINFGGRTAAVNVASQADSDTLVSVLRQLESAQGSAA